jgi:zinc/manganese transport system permease protein
MFAHEFVRNAYLAGTFIALACGTIGWFVVLRGQVFAGDALSHVAFAGAIGAAVVGVDERVGLFLLTLALAGALGALGPRAQADDVVIGTAFAWVLGIGVLLLAILATSPNGASGITTANTLFGSIYSLSAGASLRRRWSAWWSLQCWSPAPARCCWQRSSPTWRRCAACRSAYSVSRSWPRWQSSRPRARRPSALLLLGLIAAPAGGARALTARPYVGVGLSGALAVGSMWGGLALSYAIGPLPPSSAIIGLAAGCYAVCALVGRLRRRA